MRADLDLLLKALGIALGLLLAAGSVAWADEVKNGDAQRVSQEKVVKIGKVATEHVYINPHVITTLSFDKPIDYTRWPDWKEMNVERRLCHIVLRPKSLPAADIIGTMLVHTTESKVTVVLHSGRAPHNAHGHFRAEYDREPKPGNLCSKERATAQPQLVLASYNGQTPQPAVLDMSDVLLNHEIVPIREQGKVTSPYRTVVRASHWGKIERERLLFIEVENGDPRNFPIGRVGVVDEYGIADHNRAVYVESGKRDPAENIIATVPRGQRLKLAVLIRDPESLGDYVTVSVSDPEGNRTIQREKIPVWDLTPPPHDNVGRVAISITGGYGATWLGDGMNVGQLDATTLRMVGARITYGLAEYINVEAQVSLGWSDDARFEGVEFKDMVGELTHRATLGRAQLGGLIRWGDTYLPTLRLGIGAQGTSYDSRFFVDGNQLDGPDVAFEVLAFLTFGGGIDIRLGEHLQAGFELAMQQTLWRERS